MPSLFSCDMPGTRLGTKGVGGREEESCCWVTYGRMDLQCAGRQRSEHRPDDQVIRLRGKKPEKEVIEIRHGDVKCVLGRMYWVAQSQGKEQSSQWSEKGVGKENSPVETGFWPQWQNLGTPGLHLSPIPSQRFFTITKWALFSQGVQGGVQHAQINTCNTSD